MNSPFAGNIYTDFIDECCSDIIPEDMRRAQRESNTPSLERAGCRLAALLTGMLKPRTIIDIGCGIGISTLAMHIGFPQAEIYAVDGNKERISICASFLGKNPKIHIFNEYAADFLSRIDISFDFAFVDSVKREYPEVWAALLPRLSVVGAALFDDVFLYGYIAETPSLIPPKYRSAAEILKKFVQDIASQYSSFIFPIGGGMLLIRNLSKESELL